MVLGFNTTEAKKGGRTVGGSSAGSPRCCPVRRGVYFDNTAMPIGVVPAGVGSVTGVSVSLKVPSDRTSMTCNTFVRSTMYRKLSVVSRAALVGNAPVPVTEICCKSMGELALLMSYVLTVPEPVSEL